MKVSLKAMFFGGRVALAILALTGTAAAQSITAQSVMFDMYLTSDFVVQGNETWAFHAAAANAYFRNSWNGNAPTVTCSGSSANCASTNRPGTPPAPAAEGNQLNPVRNQNKCVFFEGGTLSVAPQHATYSKKVPLDGLNGKGNWFFEYTFVIAPRADADVDPETAGVQVDPRSAWDLQSSDYSPAVATLEGYLASQSTVQNNNANRRAGWSFKTSHSLMDSEGYARISDMNAILTRSYEDTEDVEMVEETELVYSVETGVDFHYSQNAGSNGPVGQLIDGALVSEIHQGLVASPNGNWDNFAGNDNSLGDRAHVYPVEFVLYETGFYGLTVTGSLKGVAGSFEYPFSVTGVINIQADDCQP